MKNLVKKYLPECVYGGVDGLVTTFAIVTASIGIGASAGVILILGIANVLADAWSMGSSDYLSSHTEAEQGGGDTNQDKPPWATASATFLAFVVVGLVPLVPFIIAVAHAPFTVYAGWVSVIATMITFIIVGYISGSISGGDRRASALRTFIVGAIAAVIAFGVAWLLKQLGVE